MPYYKLLTAGDTALVVEFGDSIDQRLSAWVLALAERSRLKNMRDRVKPILDSFHPEG